MSVIMNSLNSSIQRKFSNPAIAGSLPGPENGKLNNAQTLTSQSLYPSGGVMVNKQVYLIPCD